MNSNQLNFIEQYTCKQFQEDHNTQNWLISRNRAHLEAIKQVLPEEIKKGIVKDPKKSKSELKFISFLLNTPNNRAEMKFQETIKKKGFSVQFLNSFTDEINNRITTIFIIHPKPEKKGILPPRKSCIIVSNDKYINYAIKETSYIDKFSNL